MTTQAEIDSMIDAFDMDIDERLKKAKQRTIRIVKTPKKPKTIRIIKPNFRAVKPAKKVVRKARKKPEKNYPATKPRTIRIVKPKKEEKKPRTIRIVKPKKEEKKPRTIRIVKPKKEEKKPRTIRIVKKPKATPIVEADKPKAPKDAGKKGKTIRIVKPKAQLKETPRGKGIIMTKARLEELRKLKPQYPPPRPPAFSTDGVYLEKTQGSRMEYQRL